MSEIQHVIQADLYSLNTARLLEMARAKGVRFPINYVLPYTVQGINTIDRDRAWEYNLQDSKDIPEYIAKNPDASYLPMFTVLAQGNPFRNFLLQDNAQKDAELLNKRHIIVAMSSSDPRYPVLI